MELWNPDTGERVFIYYVEEGTDGWEGNPKRYDGTLGPRTYYPRRLWEVVSK